MSAAPSPKPSIGRIVHYVSPRRDAAGRHLPAIVTRVVEWNDTGWWCDLVVFGGDYNAAAPAFCCEDAAAAATDTWHWPEREA